MHKALLEKDEDKVEKITDDAGEKDGCVHGRNFVGYLGIDDSSTKPDGSADEHFGDNNDNERVACCTSYSYEDLRERFPKNTVYKNLP